MLTKTLNFDSDILDILRGMEWSDDGLLGRLICGQLERELYTKVNKALEAMGGKWNRKSGGHVFTDDPRGQVEGLLENGSLEVERDGFFETPQPIVERMLALVPLRKDEWILEPSAGVGAIIKRLIEKGADYRKIIAIEKNDKRVEKLDGIDCCDELYCMDFLQYGCRPDSPMLIYMNPPFEELQDIDHVKHAYEILKTGGAMVSVMAESAFFRSDKKSVAFREWLKEVYAEIIKLPAGSFEESGTMVNTRLVVIRK